MNNLNKRETVNLAKRHRRRELKKYLMKHKIITELVYLDFEEYLAKDFGEILKVGDRQLILDALQTIYLSHYN